MIRHYNTISIVVGLPGIIMQVAGRLMDFPPFMLGGTIMLLIGLAYYAKAKGRHPAWCLLAFLSCIGLLCLYFLEDRAPDA